MSPCLEYVSSSSHISSKRITSVSKNTLSNPTVSKDSSGKKQKKTIDSSVVIQTSASKSNRQFLQSIENPEVFRIPRKMKQISIDLTDKEDPVVKPNNSMIITPYG